MQILHRRFDHYYIGQIYGRDFAKICGLLRIYELYKTIQFSLSAAGLLYCRRFSATGLFLMWEILLLDFFAVGDCVTGLFCCGRFYCWTFLPWEIVVLDYFASGQMNRQATFYCTKDTAHTCVPQYKVNV